MRTVDPEQWYKKILKPPSYVAGPKHCGQTAMSNVEARFRSSFCDAMDEYWTHCSVEGVKRISDQTLTKFERYREACVFVLALWFGVSTLSYTWYQRRSVPPLHVSVQSAQHSIQRVPFPAVALCSSNLISEAALNNYTMFLYSLDKNKTFSSHDIRDNLLSLGSLVTIVDLRPLDAHMSRFMFMQFLSQMDPEFNVANILYQLAPSCASILSRCSWRGRVMPCELLFAKRVTPLGYCCVFNSRYYSEDYHRPPRYLNLAGRDYGLSLVVRENIDDFAFIRRTSVDLEVLLFDGSDYPIMEGGGVCLYPVEQNVSVFMSITTKAQYPSEETLPGCRKRSAAGPRSARSSSWCLTRCRRRTLLAVCGCQMHTLPPDSDDNNPFCSLTHLTCLNKHREKFMYYYPRGYKGEGLDAEVQNGQYCNECVTDCTRVLYAADVTTARYYFTNTSAQKIFRDTFTKDVVLVNSTVIRLFFSTEHQKVYVIEVNKRWFEIFATFSSQWAAIVGATLIAASEAIFFCTIRLVHHYRRRTHTSGF